MHIRSVVLPSCVLALVTATAGHARWDQQSLTPSADRAAFMRQHFGLVMAVHEAVIRGDLKTARQQARALADQPDPQGLPAAAAPYLATMKAAASGLATADGIEDVASTTSSMLAMCGDCHRAVGTMPAHVRPPAAEVGGAVGHMLAHKRAVDLMLQGLTVPSSSLWQQGAEVLGSAPLRRGDLPRDPKLTRDILDTEKWVHEMADRARQTTEVRSRILVYSELIQSCGTCHALHGNVWGPDNASVAAPSPYQPRLGAFVRLNQAQPILSPQGNGFETGGVFNPAVVKDGNRFVMLYRAQDRQGISRLGYATSTDGVMFTREAAPVLSPEADYEHGGGVEDPRLVRIDGLYYLTYTAYNGKDAQLALATSRDLRRWERKGVILPAYKGRWNVNWTKAGAILPQRIGGRYWMYYMADAKDGSDQTGIAYSTDLITWTEALDRPVLPRRPGRFDSRVVEPGPPPILTEDGVLLIYNGADDRLVYRTGWALFDRNDPTRLLARSDQPLFEPLTDWEKVGQVPNVVFVEGLVVEPGRWLVYYGAADKYIGAASVAVTP